jgi:hypothetical protein
MHIDYERESPEHLMLVLKRRKATLLASTIAALVLALAVGIAMVTLMYR